MFRRDPRLRLPAYAPNGAPVEYDNKAIQTLLGMTREDLWRTQPHLRTVVSFLGRNIAQLGLHTFERVSDTDRQRVRDSVAAQLLAAPNESLTTYDLINSLVSDRALYDTALWWVTRDDDRPSGWRIDPVPPSWVINSGGGTLFAPAWYDISRDGKTSQRVSADQLIVFPGWNPGAPNSGSSPVDALRMVLAEQIHAYIYRQQVWQRGGRVGDVLTRPAGNEWSSDARERFSKDWKAQWTGDDGPKAGGTPILEDGMTLQKIRFSAHEEEWVEAAKLSLSTVAQVYHVNPTMIGLLDNANFSNVREFRRMLYGDTLGPEIANIEARINTFLLPMVEEPGDHYVEFNIREKLQGSFEEQTQALQSSVGRPWMTADEARAVSNMPALGGDAAELVTPLNVLVGGQASPRDSAPKALTVRTKARPPEAYNEQVERVLVKFFRRQRSVVLSALGSKADSDWWDSARWDRELAADLQKLAHLVADQIGMATAKSLGFDDGYDIARTERFLRAVAESRAGAINSTTKDQLDKAIEDPEREPAHVFDEAEGERKTVSATTLVTTFAAFATAEAAKQVGGDSATKTWNVTSANPRASHSAMDGETVGIDESFSNGMNWPGDPAGGADEVAGCTCDVTVDIA